MRWPLRCCGIASCRGTRSRRVAVAIEAGLSYGAAMLHVRSRPRRSTVAPLLLWPWLRDTVAGSDQGLLRLQMAARGTLSVLLTTVIAVLAGRWVHFSPVECAGGITLSMMSPFLMREPTRQQRQRTLLMLVLPAIAATVATTVLHGHGPAGDAIFLLLVFVCFLFGPVSPRAIGIGLVAVITSYVGLYLELPPATLPVQIAAQILAIPIIALACFVVVPMDAAATLRRSIGTVQTRAAQVIRQAKALDSGLTDDAKTRLRGAVLQLNQAALVADDQLAFFEPGAAGAVRSRLVDVELWTARLAHHLETVAPDDKRWSGRLMLHARRIARGGRYSTDASSYEPGTLIATLVGLGQAVHGLGQALQEQRAARPALAKPPPPGPLAWRLATRVTLAAGLAMAGGMALSPQRWFWAVITVYVVFLNVRSRGETIYKGLQRLAGTLLGIGSGLVIALSFRGDGTLEAMTLLLSVFGMYYFFLSSYTLGIFFVTIMLGLLYGMLGAPLETVLLLRLEETAIGAAAAIFVAAFVLPDSTSVRVRKAGCAVMIELATALHASARALGGDPGAAPAASMRQVDRMVADLRLALAPMTATRAFMRRPALERPVSALLDCVHWTRVVVAEASTAFDGDHAVDTRSIEHAARRLEALGRDEFDGQAPAHGGTAAGSLAQLDRAITTMEQRRSLRAHEIYAIDT